jgi:hypothetical protein
MTPCPKSDYPLIEIRLIFKLVMYKTFLIQWMVHKTKPYPGETIVSPLQEQ